MARVTVEDCIQVVNNRYELVLLAAQRARDIAAGASLTVDRDNDKNPVIALREIADQTIPLDEVRRHIAKGVNRHADLNVEDDALQAIAEQGPTINDIDLSGTEIEEVTFEDEASTETAPEAGEEEEVSLEASEEDIDAAQAAMETEMTDEELAAEEDELSSIA